MDERAAGLSLGELGGARERLGRVGRLLVDRRRRSPATAATLSALAPCHMHDERVDPFERRAVRDAPAACVPGRDGDHAALALLGRQRRELREDSARLERAGALEELGLQEDVRAGLPRERRRAEHRRAVERGRRSTRRGERARSVDVLAGTSDSDAGLTTHRRPTSGCTRARSPPSGRASGRPPLAVIGAALDAVRRASPRPSTSVALGLRRRRARTPAPGTCAPRPRRPPRHLASARGCGSARRRASCFRTGRRSRACRR